MATMMKSGVPLVSSLEIIGSGHKNPRMAKLVGQIRADLEGGSSLYEAISKHPVQFDELYRNLVRAGEGAGVLETVLETIANYQENLETLKGKIKKALFYPAMGVHHDINAGAWRGLWHEKNQMAALMTFGFVACCASAFTLPQRRGLWIGAASLIFFLIIMSRSKTSLLACLLALAAMPVLSALRSGGVRGVLFVWGAATCALIGGAVFFVMPEAVFKALGKDPTLTGRTAIWDSLLRLSDQRPWLGYG